MLKATIGVSDDHKGSPGSVIFSVYDGDRHLWSSPVLKADGQALEMEVPVPGVETLVLEATDAGDGNHFDHAIWGDARVLRKEK
jgi:hypothetical protein